MNAMNRWLLLLMIRCSTANFFGHTSGKKTFKSARCCKAWLIVVRQHSRSCLMYL